MILYWNYSFITVSSSSYHPPIWKMKVTFALVQTNFIIFTFQKIQEIYPKNVYNLVSVSTGGALTIEIARHLQQEKPEAKLNMFFIDSAPTFIQNVLVQLGESNKDLEMNILRSIFNINDLKVGK